MPPELLPTDPEDVLCVTTYTLEGLSTLLDRIAFATALERTESKEERRRCELHHITISLTRRDNIDPSTQRAL